MSIRTKIIGAIVATALVTPPAFAVEGTDGMFYTSASEGLYASVRARFNTGESTTANSSVAEKAGTRFGVQGTGEMSHGLEGIFRFEVRMPDVSTNDYGVGNSYVGLRGGFGEIRMGKWDLPEYDFVTARTDLTNNGSRATGVMDFSNEQVFQYKTPDFNGLQVGTSFRFPGGDDVAGNAGVTLTVGAMPSEIEHPTNDLESWTLAANYAFGGFNVGGSYGNRTDGIHALTGGTEGTAGDVTVQGFEDYTTWGVSAGYGQDNWFVGTFYKADNMSDKGVDPAGVKHDDQAAFSIAGQVDVGKTRVIVAHDNLQNSAGGDDTATTFEIEYRLNSQAKTWVGYGSYDYDSDATMDDDFYIGLRHDF